MKIFFVLLLFTGINAVAADGQPITLVRKNATLKEIFKAIQKQSQYSFVYGDEVLSQAKPVTIEVRDAPIQRVLEICFRDQPLRYEFDGNVIIVKKALGQALPVLPSAGTPNSVVSVRGKVVDEENKAIPKATISVKGTKQVALTDNNGEFGLDQVDSRSSLIITCIGYQSLEVPIKGNPNVTARLKVAVNSLDESIVLAYRTGTRRTNVGAVSIVSGKEISTLPVRSIDRALQGVVPGLHVVSGSGLPGGGSATVVLRGIATGGLNTARYPLFVLDGTPLQLEDYTNLYGLAPDNNTFPTNPLSAINPEDIESISVLKDAAAIAIYGSQASNGVILITTKKGKSGKMKVNISHQTDFSSPITAVRGVLSQQQYLDLLYESYKNADPTATDQSIRSDLFKKFPYQVNGTDTSFYPAPDWLGEIYSDKALTLTNNLNLSGGNDKLTYYLGLGHTHQKGTAKATSFDRGSLRYNVDMKPAKWIRLGLSSNLVYTRQNLGDIQDLMTSPNGFGYYVSPLLPIRQADDQYVLRYPLGGGSTNVVNPLAKLDYNTRTADAYRAIGNVYGEVKFLRYFTFKTNLGIDFLSSKDLSVDDKRAQPSTSATTMLRDLRNLRSQFLINNMLTFQKSFGPHNLTVMASQEAQIDKGDQISGTGQNFLAGFSNDELNSASSTFANGNKTKATRIAYLGQLNYDYRQRYLASFSYRLDGYSRFGSSEPFKSFWSAGAGWIISDEPFLRSAKGWLNFLKIRGSIGVAGNTNAIPPITRSNRVAGAAFMDLGNMIGPMVLFTPGNPNVRPESTTSLDLGLETRLFNERLIVNADIYRRKTIDMVTNLSVPLIYYSSRIYGNLGDMENKGIEVSMSLGLVRTKNFSWTLNGNWSTNSNKLVRANDPESYSSKFIYRVGDTYESWYLVRWAGVDPADGSPQWLDKTGKVTKTWSTSDRVLVGKPQPDGFGGVTNTFSYKNIELSAFIYYTYGYQVYNSFLAAMLNDGRTQPYVNQSVLALNRWQKPGDVALNPKRVLNNPARGNSISTRYLEDGDHIRLKNLSMSYSLNQPMLNRLKLNSAKIFIQANNIGFLWIKSKALDPDNAGLIAESLAGYPQQKSYSIGLSVGF